MNDLILNYKYILVCGEASEKAVTLLKKFFKVYEPNYRLMMKRQQNKSEIKTFEIIGDIKNNDIILLCTSDYTEELKNIPPDRVTKVITRYAKNQEELFGYFKNAEIIQYGINEPKSDITALNVRKVEEDVLSFELLTNEGISRIKLPFRKNMLEAILGVYGVLSVIEKDSQRLSEIMKNI